MLIHTASGGGLRPHTLTLFPAPARLVDCWPDGSGSGRRSGGGLPSSRMEHRIVEIPCPCACASCSREKNQAEPGCATWRSTTFLLTRSVQPRVLLRFELPDAGRSCEPGTP